MALATVFLFDHSFLASLSWHHDFGLPFLRPRVLVLQNLSGLWVNGKYSVWSYFLFRRVGTMSTFHMFIVIRPIRKLHTTVLARIGLSSGMLSFMVLQNLLKPKRLITILTDMRHRVCMYNFMRIQLILESKTPTTLFTGVWFHTRVHFHVPSQHIRE